MENTWNDNILECIRNIADLEYQQNAWFGKSEFVSSFNEIINVLYDDNCFESFLNDDYWKDNNLNDSQLFMELDKLNYMINNYQQLENDEKIIKDPKWIAIVNQAIKVVENWNLSLL